MFTVPFCSSSLTSTETFMALETKEKSDWYFSLPLSVPLGISLLLSLVLLLCFYLYCPSVSQATTATHFWVLRGRMEDIMKKCQTLCLYEDFIQWASDNWKSRLSQIHINLQTHTHSNKHITWRQKQQNANKWQHTTYKELCSNMPWVYKQQH